MKIFNKDITVNFKNMDNINSYLKLRWFKIGLFYLEIPIAETNAYINNSFDEKKTNVLAIVVRADENFNVDKRCFADICEYSFLKSPLALEHIKWIAEKGVNFFNIDIEKEKDWYSSIKLKEHERNKLEKIGMYKNYTECILHEKERLLISEYIKSLV